VTNARLDDKQLRDLYDRILEARAAGGRASCASPERMLAVVRRAGSEEDRLSTLDHVMSCGDCAREFELVRAIEEVGTDPVASERAAARRVAPDATTTEQTPSEREPVRLAAVEPRSPARRAAIPAPSASWRRYATFALAASLLLAVGVGVMRRVGVPGNGDVTRGESAVTLLAPPTDVRSDAGAIGFVWRPVAGAVRYELEVVDSAGGVTFSATTADTTATLADTRRLTPGTAYRWWVRALDAAGAQRASDMRRLRVRNE
jgi:hypothetical protein